MSAAVSVTVLASAPVTQGRSDASTVVIHGAMLGVSAGVGAIGGQAAIFKLHSSADTPAVLSRYL
jgi:hypothetical protein